MFQSLIKKENIPNMYRIQKLKAKPCFFQIPKQKHVLFEINNPTLKNTSNEVIN